MKKVWITATTFVLVLMFLIVAGAQDKKMEGKAERPKVVKEQTSVITATVMAIDLQKRIVTLKGPKGDVISIAVGEEAKNLPQIKVGDLVTIKYFESLAVEVTNPAAPAGEGEKTALIKAAPGEMPGGMAARQTTVTATIMAIDKKKSTLSLKRADGNAVVTKVADPRNLNKVKVGDVLTITYTEAFAISVERAKKK